MNFLQTKFIGLRGKRQSAVNFNGMVVELVVTVAVAVGVTVRVGGIVTFMKSQTKIHF